MSKPNDEDDAVSEDPDTIRWVILTALAIIVFGAGCAGLYEKGYAEGLGACAADGRVPRLDAIGVCVALAALPTCLLVFAENNSLLPIGRRFCVAGILFTVTLFLSHLLGAHNYPWLGPAFGGSAIITDPIAAFIADEEADHAHGSWLLIPFLLTCWFAVQAAKSKPRRGA